MPTAFVRFLEEFDCHLFQAFVREVDGSGIVEEFLEEFRMNSRAIHLVILAGILQEF